MVAVKVGGEASRERERERILAQLTRREFGDEALGTGTGKNQVPDRGCENSPDEVGHPPSASAGRRKGYLS